MREGKGKIFTLFLRALSGGKTTAQRVGKKPPERWGALDGWAQILVRSTPIFFIQNDYQLRYFFQLRHFFQLSIRINLLSIQLKLLTDKVNLLSIQLKLLTDRVNLLSIKVKFLTDKVNLLSIKINLLTDRVNLLSIKLKLLTDKVNFLNIKKQQRGIMQK